MSSRQALLSFQFTSIFIGIFLFMTTSFAKGSTPQESVESLKQTLIDHAIRSQTDVMLVYQNGKLILDYRSPKAQQSQEPYQVMSVTKSFSSLAIGFLMDEGKIQSLETPLAQYFPEWKGKPQEAITLRHVLTHTSGIQNDESSGEVGDAPDAVKLALESELSNQPGSTFAYNSKAVNLLSGVVERLTGQTTDQYLQKKLFGPLGIQKLTWEHDPAGHAYGNAGISIQPEDLAKVGELLLHNGALNQTQILSAQWIQSLYQPSQNLDRSCSLLWWIGQDESTHRTAVSANGWLGQSLVISPSNGIVGVRLIRPASVTGQEDPNFKDFRDLLLKF